MNYNSIIATAVVIISSAVVSTVRDSLVVDCMIMYFVSFVFFGVISLISSGNLVFHDEDGFILSNKRAEKYFWKRSRSPVFLVAMLPALVIIIFRFIILEAGG